jgi:hypothetical protein
MLSLVAVSNSAYIAYSELDEALLRVVVEPLLKEAPPLAMRRTPRRLTRRTASPDVLPALVVS